MVSLLMIGEAEPHPWVLNAHEMLRPYRVPWCPKTAAGPDDIDDIDSTSTACQEARRFGAQAQQLLPKLGPRGQSNGTAAALHLTLALLGPGTRQIRRGDW